jgi:hypothetical protein
MVMAVDTKVGSPISEERTEYDILEEAEHAGIRWRDLKAGDTVKARDRVLVSELSYLLGIPLIWVDPTTGKKWLCDYDTANREHDVKSGQITDRK